ncbi:serpin family protein [Echinicola marina]|uniref:serpin family protein n=1 Tax=Echinicola marina TaxID=2859768 RepID=UPI001CF60F91|nr:serpin family protein [Echinicola marina]UCS93036.1 serpin family protein [Echinicola marina]
MKKPFIFILSLLIQHYSFSQNSPQEPNNNFAFRIYKATKPDSSNYFISPYSLNLALAMTMEGAGSSTKQELESLLSINNLEKESSENFGLNGPSNNEAPKIQPQHIKNDDGSNNNQLIIANSLWIKDNFEINAQYKDKIQTDYMADVFSFNMGNNTDPNQKLNDWVSNKTQNKIKRLNGLGKDVKLSLLNAIYFFGQWEKPFESNNNSLSLFYTITKEMVSMDFMYNQSNYQYYEDPELQAVHIPYQSNQYSMMVLLPKRHKSLLELEEKINLDYLSKIDRLSAEEEIKLTLPKMKIESEINPIKDIKKMGYSLMFSNKADFSGISSKDSLKIGEIIHKTTFETNEIKSEATAASLNKIVIVGNSAVLSQPKKTIKQFHASRPFIFFITDNKTGSIIFTGRFVR